MDMKRRILGPIGPYGREFELVESTSFKCEICGEKWEKKAHAKLCEKIHKAGKKDEEVS